VQCAQRDPCAACHELHPAQGMARRRVMRCICGAAGCMQSPVRVLEWPESKARRRSGTCCRAQLRGSGKLLVSHGAAHPRYQAACIL